MIYLKELDLEIPLVNFKDRGHYTIDLCPMKAEETTSSREQEPAEMLACQVETQDPTRNKDPIVTEIADVLASLADPRQV